MKPHPNVVNVRFAHIMGFCSESEEYICFEDFVTGRDLGDLVAEGKGELYNGTTAEVTNVLALFKQLRNARRALLALRPLPFVRVK